MGQTVTEALAELRTIGKRLEKKRGFVRGYLWRQEMRRDPFEKEGGAWEVLARERQAIGDLEERVVVLRRAITEANLSTELDVLGEVRSVYDWLTWRREVSEGRRGFLGGLQSELSGMRSEAARRGVRVTARGDEPADHQDIVVNVSEKELAESAERLEEILGVLDGKLSLVNALTVVEV